MRCSRNAWRSIGAEDVETTENVQLRKLYNVSPPIHTWFELSRDPCFLWLYREMSLCQRSLSYILFIYIKFLWDLVMVSAHLFPSSGSPHLIHAACLYLLASSSSPVVPPFAHTLASTKLSVISALLISSLELIICL